MKKISFILVLILLFSCNKKNDNILIKNQINKDLILDLVNEVRMTGCNCGGEEMPPVDPVEWDNRLEAVAKIQSQYMYNCYLKRDTTCDCFNHYWCDGTTIGDRFEMVGFKYWRGFGENIAWGQRSEEEVIQSWLDSPGHCKNIMSPVHEKMGVARTDWFWSMDFITEN